MKRPALLATTLLALLLAASACHRKSKDAPEALRFSEDELWDQSQALLKDEKWRKAGEYLKLLLDQYPSGKHVRQAQLAYADTLYRRGSDANLIEAQAKYMAFVAFFPEDDNAAFAQYRVAMCNYERRGKPNRDLAVTRDAIAEFEKVSANFPKSSYVDDAKAKVRELRDELAEHEYLVAHFYDRRGFETSVVRRLKFLLEKYPDYSHKDKVYMLLGETLSDEENYVESSIYLEKLVQEYPNSEERHDAESLLRDVH